MKQKLYCYSQFEIENLIENNDSFVMDDNTIIISICAPWNEKKEHPLPDSDKVLNVDFDDIDPRCLKLEDGTEVFDNETNHIQFITYSQAEKIVDFIENNKDKDIVVHCYAGISRSQGVVRYVLDTYFDHEWETRESNPCVCPNMYVVMMLKRKFREKYYG